MNHYFMGLFFLHWDYQLRIQELYLEYMQKYVQITNEMIYDQENKLDKKLLANFLN